MSHLQSGLTPEALTKARDELNEQSHLIETMIVEIRDRVEEYQKQNEFRCPKLNEDRFVVRFLRVSKYDPDKAFRRFVKYHEFAMKQGFEGGSAAPFLENGFDDLYLAGVRDENGAQVVICRCEKLQENLLTGRKTYREIMKEFWFFQETLFLKDPDVQVNGAAFVFDCTGFGLSVARKIPLEDQELEHAIMNVIPLRIKTIVILNSPWYLRWFFKIYIMFASAKMKKRFVFASPETVSDALPGIDDFADENWAEYSELFLERIRYIDSLED